MNQRPNIQCNGNMYIFTIDVLYNFNEEWFRIWMGTLLSKRKVCVVSCKMEIDLIQHVNFESTKKERKVNFNKVKTLELIKRQANKQTIAKANCYENNGISKPLT